MLCSKTTNTLFIESDYREGRQSHNVKWWNLFEHRDSLLIIVRSSDSVHHIEAPCTTDLISSQWAWFITVIGSFMDNRSLTLDQTCSWFACSTWGSVTNSGVLLNWVVERLWPAIMSSLQTLCLVPVRLGWLSVVNNPHLGHYFLLEWA